MRMIRFLGRAANACGSEGGGGRIAVLDGRASFHPFAHVRCSVFARKASYRCRLRVRVETVHCLNHAIDEVRQQLRNRGTNATANAICNMRSPAEAWNCPRCSAALHQISNRDRNGTKNSQDKLPCWKPLLMMGIEVNGIESWKRTP